MGEKQNLCPNLISFGLGEGQTRGRKFALEPTPVVSKTRGLPENRTRIAIPIWIN
jgi:hypothetical protein